MNLVYWFLVFYIFSIIGYISEVIYCYILDKKIVNRGFLHGPYCPIYGFGALACIVLLNKYFNDPLIVFTLSMLLCSIIEYMTSYFMEKIFNDKWWDYSNNKYNINGRVCLKNSILFGIGGLGVIYIFYPFIKRFMYNAYSIPLNIITILIFLLFFIDLIFTILDTLKLKKQLRIIDKIRNEIEDIIPDKLQTKINEALIKYKRYPKHIINAFPNIKNNHEQNIKLLKDVINKKKKK